MHADRIGGGVFLHAAVREQRPGTDWAGRGYRKAPMCREGRQAAVDRRLPPTLASDTQSFADGGTELVERERLAEKSIGA